MCKLSAYCAPYKRDLWIPARRIARRDRSSRAFARSRAAAALACDRRHPDGERGREPTNPVTGAPIVGAACHTKRLETVAMEPKMNFDARRDRAPA